MIIITCHLQYYVYIVHCMYISPPHYRRQGIRRIPRAIRSVLSRAGKAVTELCTLKLLIIYSHHYVHHFLYNSIILYIYCQ